MLAATGRIAAIAARPRAQQKQADANDPRVRLKPGIARRGRRGEEHGAGLDASTPEGFFDPKKPAGLAMPGERPGNATPPAAAASHRTANRRDTRGRPGSPALRAQCGRAAGPGTRLRQLRSRLQRHAHGHGQLPRLQRLRHRTRESPRLLASMVCPGGQGDVSIYGNLLFMSVEQTRGRLDCGTQGVVEPVSDERFRGVRIFDISDITQAQAGRRRADLPRLAHAHAGPRSEGQATSTSMAPAPARCGRARSWSAAPASDSEGGSEHRAVQHRRDRGAAGAPQNARIVNRPRIFIGREDRRASAACGRAAIMAPARSASHDQPVPRHHGVSGSRSRRGRMLGQRHPDGHQRSGESEASRPRRRQELRLLALGDVQQRRHQDPLHGRMGRRHAAALPRNRPANWGADAIFDIVDKKMVFRGYYKMPAAQSETGELRRAQRLADPGAGPRHHGAGVVSGRPVDVRLHRCANPKEIAYFDRGPIDARTWSSAATGRPTGTTAASTAPRSRAASTSSS